MDDEIADVIATAQWVHPGPAGPPMAAQVTDGLEVSPADGSATSIVWRRTARPQGAVPLYELPLLTARPGTPGNLSPPVSGRDTTDSTAQWVGCEGSTQVTAYELGSD